MRKLPLHTRLLNKAKNRLGIETQHGLAELYPEYRIGRGSYGDLEVFAYPGDATLRMGAYCSVAGGVKVFLGGEHRVDWVSTYPFSATDPAFAHLKGHPATKGDVVIGSDVWIGREAMIGSGVTIGDGAVIGARALVVKDVPPYAIVGGNPARLIRTRFDPDIIEALLRIRWWDWPEERVKRAVPLLMSDDIKGFIEAAERGRL